MLGATLIDTWRLTVRSWLRSPVVTIITFLSFALAAAAICIALDMARFMREDAYREYPPDIGAAIGYLAIAGETVGETRSRAVFGADLLREVRAAPDVAGVFATVDDKRILVDGRELRGQMIIYSGIYPFSTPGERNLLRAAETEHAVVVCDVIAGQHGIVPHLLQAFPDREVLVQGMVRSSLRSRTPTFYYPVDLLPPGGGVAEIGLVAADPRVIDRVLDDAVAALNRAYPDRTVYVDRQLASARLRARLDTYRALSAAFAGLSLAVLLVAAANLVNLFALVLLRQARSLVIRRAIGLSPARTAFLAVSCASGLATAGAVAGCLGGLPGRALVGLDVALSPWSAGLTVVSIALIAAAVVAPIVRRITGGDPGALIRGL